MTEDHDSGDVDAGPESVSERSSEAPGRRRVALFVGGGVLVIIAVALGIWALWPVEGNDIADPTPTASATASATPQATPTASASASAKPSETAAADESDDSKDEPAAPVEPTAVAATIDSFTVSPETVVCPDDRASTVSLTFTWSTTDADQAWIAAGTNDASVQPFDEVALNSPGYTALEYECFMAEQLFTLTVKGEDGNASSSLSVVRELE